MGANASRVKAAMDVAANSTLRLASDGAETATATETAVPLGILSAAYWDSNKEVPHGTIRVVVDVTAIDRTTGDETYTLTLQVDDTLAQSDTPQTVCTLGPLVSTGVYEMLVDSKTINAIVTDYSGNELWMAIKATLGGTTPSITYAAWIADSPVI